MTGMLRLASVSLMRLLLMATVTFELLLSDLTCDIGALGIHHGGDPGSLYKEAKRSCMWMTTCGSDALRLARSGLHMRVYRLFLPNQFRSIRALKAALIYGDLSVVQSDHHGHVMGN